MAPNSTIWERVPIVDLCAEHVDCVNRTAPVMSERTPFKMIRTTNVRNGFIDTDNVKYVTEETYIRWTRRLLPKRGDVILTREAPLGDVGKIRTNDFIFLGQRLYHFRPDPKKLDADFLLYALMAPDLQSQIRALGSGSTVEHMRLGDIPSLVIDIPTLPLQRRIAGILSAYDELIENNQRRIKILEEMARSLYREWFVHFRFPGHEHVNITDGLPEGWERVSASEAFEVNPPTPRDDDGIITYVPMASLSEVGMVIDQAPLEGRQESTSVRFQNGDTLFARITPCLENGKTGFVQFLADGEVACGSTEFIVLRERRVSRFYVYLTAREPAFRENAVRSMIGSSGRQRVQSSCFDRYFVAVPPETLRTIFDDSVGGMFKQVANLDNQNRKLAQARDLLLPRLMNGEIVV